MDSIPPMEIKSKIVRLGERYGQETDKNGKCFQGYQRGVGKQKHSGGVGNKARRGRNYRNAKLDRHNRNVVVDLRKKGRK